MICPQVEDKVCGTDGVTYQNECELRVASCRKSQFVMIASQGPCGKISTYYIPGCDFKKN